MKNGKNVFLSLLVLCFIISALSHAASKQAKHGPLGGAPSNDDCSNATAIGDGSSPGETLTATGDGIPTCGASSGPDVWFLYTAPATATVSATLSGADFDSVLSLHDPTIDGCPGDALDEITCNDDCSPLNSCATFNATSGTQYLIRIGGFEGANGNFLLSLFASGEISGTIIDASTSNPLENAKVEIYDTSGNLVSGGTTDASGAYTAKNVATGTYYAKTTNQANYINEVFDNIVCHPACDPTTGTQIAVTAGATTPNIDFALDPAPTCLFCDDFNDSNLPANWTFTNGTWMETGGSLVGTHTKKARAIATPAFAGCILCSVTAVVETNGGPGSKLSFFAWFLDKKNNIELLMKEETDKWILKQRVNGVVVAKQKFAQTIDPDTDYTIEIVFDGTNFLLEIDGVPATPLPSAAGPNGTVGFQVKGTMGKFDSITVN